MRSLLYIWAAPVTLLGLLLSVIAGGHNYRWSWSMLVGGAYLSCDVKYVPSVGVPRVVAMTLGWLVMYGKPPSVKTILHEDAHVRQALWLGPLILLAYPLASLLALCAGGHLYFDNIFEIKAREAAGQKR